MTAARLLVAVVLLAAVAAVVWVAWDEWRHGSDYPGRCDDPTCPNKKDEEAGDG